MTSTDVCELKREEMKEMSVCSCWNDGGRRGDKRSSVNSSLHTREVSVVVGGSKTHHSSAHLLEGEAELQSGVRLTFVVSWKVWKF